MPDLPLPTPTDFFSDFGGSQNFKKWMLEGYSGNVEDYYRSMIAKKNVIITIVRTEEAYRSIRPSPLEVVIWVE